MLNRHPRISRQVRPTALIYCEGAHDLAFVRHIKKLYASRSATNTRFKAQQGGGGSPDSIVRETLRIPDDFDRYLVKVDNDRSRAEHDNAVAIAQTKDNIEICWNTPCLDTMLLSILNPGKNYSGYQSRTCKHEFQRDYIQADKRRTPASYDRHFTLEVLEEARQKIPDLDQLIKFFEA
jgi:hypothetical protein